MSGSESSIKGEPILAWFAPETLYGCVRPVIFIYIGPIYIGHIYE